MRVNCSVLYMSNVKCLHYFDKRSSILIAAPGLYWNPTTDSTGMPFKTNLWFYSRAFTRCARLMLTGLSVACPTTVRLSCGRWRGATQAPQINMWIWEGHISRVSQCPRRSACGPENNSHKHSQELFTNVSIIWDTLRANPSSLPPLTFDKSKRGDFLQEWLHWSAQQF